MDPESPENLAVARTYLDNAERLLNRLERSPLTWSTDWQAAHDLTPSSVREAPTATTAIRSLRTQTNRRADRAISRRHRSRLSRQLTRAATATLKALLTETLVLGASSDRSVATLTRLLAVAPSTGTLVAAAATAEICAEPGFDDLGTAIVDAALTAYVGRIFGLRRVVRNVDPSTRALELAIHARLGRSRELDDATADVARRAAMVWEQTGQYDRAYTLLHRLDDRVGMRRVTEEYAAHLLATERLAAYVRDHTGSDLRVDRVPITALVSAADRRARTADEIHLVIMATYRAGIPITSVPRLWQRYADACRTEGREHEALRVEAELHRAAVRHFEHGEYGQAADIVRTFAEAGSASPDRMAMGGELVDRLARTEIDLTSEALEMRNALGR